MQQLNFKMRSKKLLVHFFIPILFVGMGVAFFSQVAHAACPAGFVEIQGRNGGTTCRNTGSSGPLQVPSQSTNPNANNTNTSESGSGGALGGPRGALGGPGGTVGGPSGSANLQNPLSFGSITEVLLTILDVLIIFMVPIIILFIIYAGFLYVTARGNQSTIETAHRTLLYAVIGGLLILGARALLAVIQGTVNQLL